MFFQIIMYPDSTPIAPDLAQSGLNLQAAFNVALLPDSIQQALPDAPEDWQLLLFANGGGDFWWSMQEWLANLANNDSLADPVDSFGCFLVERWCKQNLDEGGYRLLYPKHHGIDLQQLGLLAGWHHDSLLKIGMHPEYGTWFAYRVLVLARTNYAAVAAESIANNTSSPCPSCAKPCITACPAGAVTNEGFDLSKCAAYRLQTGSPCAFDCLARRACPAGSRGKYSDEQIRYHYSQSLRHLC